MKRVTTWPSLLFVVVCSCGWACDASAQPADAPLDPLAPVRSLGKPPVWKPFTGGYYGLDSTEDDKKSGGGAYFGVYKDLMPSIVGIGASAEGYLGGYSGVSGVDGGARALLELRGLHLKAGVDYDFQRDDTSFILSLTLPLRRGGVFGHGTHVRVDWLPGRGNSWNFGVQVPLEPHMGKTRPRDTEVALPRGRKPAAPTLAPPVVAAMAEVRKAARQATILNAMFWRDHRSDRLKSLETSRAEMQEFKSQISQTDPLRPRGLRMDNEVQILHDQLDLAFGLAAEASEAQARSAGAPLAALAREVLLDEVIYPYDRLFGQYKKPEDLWGLAARARERFASRLAASSAAGANADTVRLVFDDYVQVIEELRDWGLASNHGRLARDVDPAAARAAARAVRHPAGARRHPVAGAADASRRGQQRLLLERAAVAADAAPQHPRHPGLSRALAPRLRRGGPRRRRRQHQLLHHRRGLPEGTDRARARVRQHREAPRVHDPGRPQLLGGEQGPALHRRAAGPAAHESEAAEAGRRGEPEDAGGCRARARRAARGGRGLEAPAAGSVPARAGLAAQVRVGAPQRHEPGGLLLSHQPPARATCRSHPTRSCATTARSSSTT